MQRYRYGVPDEMPQHISPLVPVSFEFVITRSSLMLRVVPTICTNETVLSLGVYVLLKVLSAVKLDETDIDIIVYIMSTIYFFVYK